MLLSARYVALAVIACAMASMSSHAQVDAKSRAKFEPPDGVTWHGVCLPGSWADADLQKNLDAYRANVTKQPLVLHSLFLHAQEHGKWRTWHWMNETPDGGKCVGEGKSYVELARKNGMVPVIAWGWINYFDEENSPSLKDVPTGKFDWYLDDWIKGIKAYKDPIFIRLSHEMDGDWYPYSEGYKKNPTRNTAADYVAYWKYVVDRFRKAGVTNVAWVWCVNGDRSGGKDWPDYYPGDEYVDWLAIDLYSSRNPRPVVDEFLKLYGKTGKPIMIPEGGTGPEQTQWNKQFPGDAAWMKEFFDVIEATPQIKALCWFQWDKQWNVERDAGQLAEYQKRIAGKRFQADFSVAQQEKNP